MKTWFITGAARGLGRALTEAALDRGDRVAAAARDTRELAKLAEAFGDLVLPVRLDVTDRAAVQDAVGAAREALGRLDVVVNNAGFGINGAVEEATESDVRSIFEANVFGALWVTQAALPHLRDQGAGHIVQVSSVAGVAAFPMIGLYCASKAALEALSESLAAEVAPMGVKVTLVEPGAMRTDWAHRSMRRAGGALEAYATQYEARLEAMADEFEGRSPGDPARIAAAMLDLVDLDDPPLRILMGNGAYDAAVSRYRGVLDEWARWEAVARGTDFPVRVP